MPKASKFSLPSFMANADFPPIDPSALQSGFQKFYHYQPFNKEFLTDTLRDQRLHCSDPHSVNDPWDCKPWFDHRPMLEDPAKREGMIVAFRHPDTFHHPGRPMYEKQLREDDSELIEAVERFSQNVTEELGKRRLYCLTPVPDSTLMRSHYADRHRGICLEFDKNNGLIGRARPVRYSKTYPEWIPQGTNNPLEVVLAKSMDWAYEREFRIIASSLDGPLKLHGDFVLLPPGALTAVIVGCESPHYDEVASVAKEFAPSVPVRRMVRAPNEYRLTVQG
jgi:hypothetical protein